MKLQTLRSENFGVFRQRRFDFGSDGFVLVHGPNEAGKSTLLQLLREMLFGFPHSSPYAFNSGKPAVEAEAILRDGRQLIFRRRKGRGDTVEGTLTGESAPIDDQRLTQLLGHASPMLYNNVFAFSLSELSSGVEGLKDAGLTDALFGGGLGGLANLQRIKRDLREHHEGLFKPSARKLPVNKLCDEIKQTKKRLAEVAIKPREYGELQERYAKLRADVALAQEQQRAIGAESARLDRLIRGWKHWQERELAQHELAQLSVTDAFKPGDAIAFQELQERLRELREEVESLAGTKESSERDLKALQCEDAFLLRAGEIKALAQEIGKIEGFLRDLPMRQGEYDQVLVKINTTLQSLHRDWTRERLAALRLSLDERTKVRELAKESLALAKEIETCQEDIARYQSSLSAKQKRLENTQEDADLDAIGLALAGEAEWKTQRTAASQAQRTQTRLLDELQLVAERLQATLQVSATLETLQPPLVSAIEEYRDRLGVYEQKLAAVREKHVQLLTQHEQTQIELRNLEATGQVPDSEQLSRARQKRDALWKLVREHFCERTAREQEITQLTGKSPDELPLQYTEQLQATDHLADERFRLANLVATKEELLRRERQAREACEKSAQDLKVLASEQEAEVTRWQQLWKPCEIVPQSPAVMLEWLRYFENYRQKLSELRDAKQTQLQAEQAGAQFEQQFRELLADAATPIDRLLHTARTRLNESKHAGGRRHEVEQDLLELRAQLDEAEQRHAQLLAAQTTWRDRWRKQLTALQLPPEWEVSAIEQLLLALEQVFHDEQVAGELGKRIEQMVKERDEFDGTSGKLAGELAAELKSLPMVERVRQLEQRCDAARETKSKQVALENELARLTGEIAAKSQRFLERQQRHTAMLATVGVKTADEYVELAQRAARRDALAEEVRAAQRALGVARESEPEADFEDQLRTADLQALRDKRDALQSQIKAMSESIEGQLKECGKLQSELAQLNEEGESLSLQQAMEHQRGQLREHVQQWSSLVLAEKLLEAAIEKFQRDHQPAVLGEARRLYEHLTQGEHVDIQHTLGDSFWVVDRQGNARRPDELSRGAREQLYLAFRLAYVRHYCQDSEPLPLIMDDVLVNFDEARIGQTLSALYELSRELQIIFLTCHNTTVELVKQHCSSCHAIELASERPLLVS